MTKSDNLPVLGESRVWSCRLTLPQPRHSTPQHLTLRRIHHHRYIQPETYVYATGAYFNFETVYDVPKNENTVVKQLLC